MSACDRGAKRRVPHTLECTASELSSSRSASTSSATSPARTWHEPLHLSWAAQSSAPVEAAQYQRHAYRTSMTALHHR